MNSDKNMKILDYRNVSFEDVSTKTSVDIEKGEFCMIVSENSHVQSAFLKSIYGMHRLSQGRANVLGRELSSLSVDDLADLRKEIGLVLSIEALPKLMNAEEIYETILLAQGVKTESISQLVKTCADQLGLGAVMQLPIQKLSEETKQLVCIGAALIKKPQLLLAEHPTAYLSEKNTELVMKLIYQLSKESKMTTIIATHDRQFLQDYPSRNLELHS